MFNNGSANGLWVEKYRPKTFKEAALPDEYYEKFKSYVDLGEIPNLMLVGSPGTGKSTCARILVESILTDESDLLYYNGSKTTGVDNIRENVESFLMSSPMGESKIKIVYIDEAEYLSQNAQAALRGIFEEFSGCGRFLFTLNNENKIIEPLHSRFQKFYFKSMPKDYVRKYVNKILDAENKTCVVTDFEKIISTYYPDIRKIVNVFQSAFNSDGWFSMPGLEVNERLFEILDSIVSSAKNGKADSQSLNSIIKIIGEGEVDYIPVYTSMFFDRNYPAWVRLIASEYQQSHQNSPVPHMHFSACILKIMKTGVERKKL